VRLVCSHRRARVVRRDDAAGVSMMIGAPEDLFLRLK
jgi:hypothetical protein